MDHELGVLSGGVTGFHEVLAGVGADRPVVVLAGSVDASEGLLVQEASEVVLSGDVSHDLHHNHVVIAGDAHRFEDRGHLVLSRSDFVMSSGGGDSESPEVPFDILNVSEDSSVYGSEIVIFHLLAFGWLGADEGSSASDEIRSGNEESSVDKEKLLFDSHIRVASGDALVSEELKKSSGSFRDRFVTS